MSACIHTFAHSHVFVLLPLHLLLVSFQALPWAPAWPALLPHWLGHLAGCVCAWRGRENLEKGRSEEREVGCPGHWPALVIDPNTIWWVAWCLPLGTYPPARTVSLPAASGPFVSFPASSTQSFSPSRSPSQSPSLALRLPARVPPQLRAPSTVSPGSLLLSLGGPYGGLPRRQSFQRQRTTALPVLPPCLLSPPHSHPGQCPAQSCAGKQ